ncbi:MAG: glycosyltransferase [Desulfomonilaceae bacterium]
MKLPRIVFLTTSYPSYSDDWTGAFIANLALALKKRGYPLLVICPAVPGRHGRFPVNGVETVRFAYFLPRSLQRLTGGEGGIPENVARSFLARAQVAPMMAVFLYTVLRETSASDILYANWLGAAIVGAAARTLTKAPLVVSLRGDDGYLARERPVWKFLTKWVIRKSTYLAPVSRELLDIATKLGAPPSKCTVPRFGVDVELFHPASEDDRRDGGVRVVFVGSLVPKKGLQDLLLALSDPNLADVQLIVVGNGAYAGRLKALARELGLSERTTWRGLLSPPQVAQTLRQADIFCLPSYTEGSPNVIKEAMASGLPVVATRAGGIPDLVSDNVNGFLYDAGDVNALKKCIASLAKSENMRRVFGQMSRQMVEERRLTWDAAAEDFDRIFQRIARAHCQPRASRRDDSD